MGKRKHRSDSDDDCKRKRKKSSSSSSSSYSSFDSEFQVKNRRKCNTEDGKSIVSPHQMYAKDEHTGKHKHKKKRKSDKSEKTKQKKKKVKKEHKKHKKHRRSHDSSPECFGPKPPTSPAFSELHKYATVTPADDCDDGMKKKGVMAPMTKEQWEKQRCTVRRVYDPETGRNRLVRGNGEILEEIVSKKSHAEINKRATMTDGLFYQLKAGELSKSTHK